MVFAEFYQNSTGWNGKDFSGPVKIIPACGDRAVVILDGRQSTDTHVQVAREECVKRGYRGFTLNAGDTFTRSRETRSLEVVA